MEMRKAARAAVPRQTPAARYVRPSAAPGTVEHTQTLAEKMPTAPSAAKAAPQAAPAAPAPAAQAAPKQSMGSQGQQVYCAAYVKEFTINPASSSEGFSIPLEQQRASGGFGFYDGGAKVPLDGYYMVLWELGIAQAKGQAQLQLGIGGASALLTHTVQPGYDSGQQVTWLNAGDQLRLFFKAENLPLRIIGSSAMLTVIRLG